MSTVSLISVLQFDGQDTSLTSATTGTAIVVGYPDYPVRDKQSRSLELDLGTADTQYATNWNSDHWYYMACHLYWATIPSVGTNIFQSRNSVNGLVRIKADGGTGVITVRDANGVGGDPIALDQEITIEAGIWYTFQIAAKFTGELKVWANKEAEELTKILDTTGQDLGTNDGTVFAQIGADFEKVYVSDVIFYRDDSTYDLHPDMPMDFTVIGPLQTVNPFASSNFGDNLTTGVWDDCMELPFNDAYYVSHLSSIDGGGTPPGTSMASGARSGPKNNSDFTNKIAGAFWHTTISRDTGNDTTFHMFAGANLNPNIDSTAEVATAEIIYDNVFEDLFVGRTAIGDVIDADVPGIDEYAQFKFSGEDTGPAGSVLLGDVGVWMVHTDIGSSSSSSQSSSSSSSNSSSSSSNLSSSSSSSLSSSSSSQSSSSSSSQSSSSSSAGLITRLVDFAGFETQGIEELGNSHSSITASDNLASPTPYPNSETRVIELDYRTGADNDDGWIRSNAVTTEGSLIFGAYIQYQGLTGDRNVMRGVAEDIGSGYHWSIIFDSDTTIEIEYADGTTTSHDVDFNTDVWYLVEVFWDKSNYGHIKVYFDNVLVANEYGDLDNGSYDGVAAEFRGGSSIGIPSNPLDIYVGSYYILNQVVSDDDRLGHFSVVGPYQNTSNNTSVPDFGADNLFISTWDQAGETPGTGGQALYFYGGALTREGGCTTDSGIRSGPSGDSRIISDAAIYGAKWIFDLNVSSAKEQDVISFKYGKTAYGDPDTDNTVLRTVASEEYNTTTTIFEDVKNSSLNLPTSTDDFQFGIKCVSIDDSGNTQVGLNEFWGFILQTSEFVSSSSSKSSSSSSSSSSSESSSSSSSSQSSSSSSQSSSSSSTSSSSSQSSSSSSSSQSSSSSSKSSSSSSQSSSSSSSSQSSSSSSQSSSSSSQSSSSSSSSSSSQSSSSSSSSQSSSSSSSSSSQSSSSSSSSRSSSSSSRSSSSSSSSSSQSSSSSSSSQSSSSSSRSSSSSSSSRSSSSSSSSSSQSSSSSSSSQSSSSSSSSQSSSSSSRSSSSSSKSSSSSRSSSSNTASSSSSESSSSSSSQSSSSSSQSSSSKATAQRVVILDGRLFRVR